MTDYPETKMVACPFCGTEREGKRTGSGKPRGSILGGQGRYLDYAYAAPLCNCQGAEDARKVSAEFNRRIRGR